LLKIGDDGQNYYWLCMIAYDEPNLNTYVWWYASLSLSFSRKDNFCLLLSILDTAEE